MYAIVVTVIRKVVLLKVVVQKPECGSYNLIQKITSNKEIFLAWKL